MLTIVREDAVCRRLMTVPSVGPIVAITYKSAMDDPNRIAKSKSAGALFGLTPKKYQSGEKDVTGGITRAGDEMVRTALYEAANVLLARITRFSKLKRWGMDVAKPSTHIRCRITAILRARATFDGLTPSRPRCRYDKEKQQDASRLNASLLPEVPSPGRWMR